MAVTASPYGQLSIHLGTGLVDFTNGSVPLTVLLTDNTYTPDVDADDYVDDITGEVVAASYSRQVVANVSFTYDSGNNVAVLDGDNVTWIAADFTARYAVLFLDSGTDSTSPLVGYVDFGADQAPSGIDFTVSWDANGILRIVVM